jgi:hypothetical protein
MRIQTARCKTSGLIRAPENGALLTSQNGLLPTSDPWSAPPGSAASVLVTLDHFRLEARSTDRRRGLAGRGRGG